MEETVNIGLIGFGTIGSGVVATLNQNIQLLESKVNKKVNLKRIVDLDITTDRGVEVKPGVLSTNVDDILEDDEIDIVIELVGGYQPALNFILKAMENGKHVVTANKALLAKHWQEITDSAQKNGVRIAFEASVGGGIPLLAPLNDGLTANNIETIYGIINGTANYILTKMAAEGLDFDTVLKEAQEMGYAEADPTFDIEGHDTAQKLIILSILGFGVYVKQERFHVEGITRITPDDIRFAREELESVIKLLAIAQITDGELEIRVHPTLVPETHLLAAVNDVFNAVYLVGDVVGPVLMYGAGAGMMPTASAVVADCIDIIQDMERPVAYGPKETRVEKIKDISEVESKYYLRITALDEPGVLHSISGVLSDLDISIESVSQKKADKGEAVPIFIVTHHALEKNVQEALTLIDQMDFVKEETVLIRLL
ncbi:homoserine dehydrogenase [Methanobacterium formicicum]|uniref:Homoserine dehydrogenase n=1 Tax=Methanobacterium formicicum (strain DSM 3637 / PP1) TaxID=1204725 RepID=K2RE61_METFP|nr:homoserine dehydrogenase [Methanobacterium formicicum]EKF86639.1 homoserine dehydrogenase [Methanobacterium formicicum DSM 3637]